MARFAVGLSLVLLISSLTFSQVDSAAGIQMFSTRENNIDLATSSITVDYPIRSKAGKIPVSFALLGNYHVYPETLGTSHTLAISTSLQPQLHAHDYGYTITYTSQQTTSCNGNQHDVLFLNYVVIDQTGASHPLPTSIKTDSNNPPCYTWPTTPESTTDGSGLTVTSSGLYDKSGFSYVASGTLTDPDGATVTLSGSNPKTYTDSLGTTFLTSTVYSHPSTGTSDTYVYTDASGNNRTYTVAYTEYTLRSNFGCAALDFTYLDYNDSSAPTYLPTSITSPTGAVTTIAYETTPGVSGAPYGTYTTGRLASITYGSGGSISYAYSQNSDAQGNNGLDCASFVVPKMTVTLNDNNGNASTWTYINSNRSGTPGNFTVTKTDPAGNQTTYNFSGEYQTQAVSYQGTSTVLQTVTTCYNGNLSNCVAPSAVPTLPITETDVYTSLGTSAANRVKTVFDPSYGNVLSISRYDWGASTPTSISAGTGGSSNNVAYGSYVNGTGCVALGNYINDRPCGIDVYDGSGNLYQQALFTYNTTGHPTSEYDWVGGSTSLQSTASYNSNGTLAWTKDYAGNKTTFGYAASGSGGCNGLLLTSTTYPLTSVGSDSQTWDCNGGVVSTKTDVNGNVTSYTYNDPLYRLTQIAYPDSSADTLSIAYQTDTPPWSVTKTKAVTSSGSLSVQTNLDGLERPIETLTSDPIENYIYQTTTYNKLGEVYTVSNPYYSTSDPTYGLTTYGYDALGRTTSITPPISNDATTISYTSRAWETTHGGVSKIYQMNGLGQTYNVCEVTTATQNGSSGNVPTSCALDVSGTGFLSGMSYDALGRMSSFCAGASQCRSLTYDGLSRLTSESYPESGTKSYTYDTLQAGDLYQRTAPKPNQTGSTQVVTTYTFDAMNRPLNISYNDGLTPSIGFGYDKSSEWNNTLPNPKGHLSLMSTSLAGGTTDAIFGYDAVGNVNLYGQCTPLNCTANTPNYFVTSYSYNFVGEPSGGSSFLPGGMYWTNTYDNSGRLKSAWTSYLTSSSSGNLVYGTTYNALGEVTSDTLENGIAEAWSYDQEGRPQSYSAGSIYGYSNLTYSPQLTSSQDMANGDWSYTYDSFNRIATANQTGGQSFTYSYDRWGNRWGQVSGVNQYTFNSNNQMTTGGITYDAAGNITYDGFHSYSYDAEGRILTVDSGSTATYAYNSRGWRVSRLGYENLFDLGGNIVSSVVAGTTSGSFSRYTTQGRLLAASMYNSGTTNFYHQDWLGGIRALSLLNGTLSTSCTSYPFGDGNNGCGLWYYSQLMYDTEDNLNTSMTRGYAPVEGRWTVPDPAGLAAVDPTNPQSWNRYAYVTNNPLSFVDPLGLYMSGDIGGDGGDSGSYGAPQFNASLCLTVCSQGLGFNLSLPTISQFRSVSFAMALGPGVSDPDDSSAGWSIPVNVWGNNPSAAANAVGFGTLTGLLLQGGGAFNHFLSAFSINTFGSGGIVRTLQSGRNTITKGTADALNELSGEDLTPRDWGRLVEELKGDEGIPNDVHGAIWSDGTYAVEGEVGWDIVGNILQYLP